MLNIGISGLGVYAPGQPISNDELAKLTGLTIDAERLEGKLGIRSRHNAKLRGLDLSTADFAEKAALSALENAKIDPLDIDIIIVATDTPEYISPPTSILIQGRLQKSERATLSLDINATCASFTSAFHVAANLLAANHQHQRALVIGAYNMPAFLRAEDSFGHSIFADGAGAIVLERTAPSSSTYLGGLQLTDGTQWDYIGIYHGAAKNPINRQALDAGKYGLESLKPLPGDRNLRLWPKVIRQLLANHGLGIGDVDHFLFTQINRTVIEEVMFEIDAPIEKTTFIMDEFGYTGSACIPMALTKAVACGVIKRGSRVLTIASGAGLEVAANLFTY